MFTFQYKLYQLIILFLFSVLLLLVTQKTASSLISMRLMCAWNRYPLSFILFQIYDIPYSYQYHITQTQQRYEAPAIIKNS